MELPDLKQLKALIHLCRKQGVTTVEIGGMKLTLGAPPVSPSAKKAGAYRPDNFANPDEPSAEDLLFWSAGGEQQ